MTIQITEHMLLEAATPVFNYSCELAAFLNRQHKELGMFWRIKAETLVNEWNGTRTQIFLAREIITAKRFSVNHGR
jgi:hypothetical protein